jgi:threonine/homoserine/homoserine lactone efflux protein
LLTRGRRAEAQLHPEAGTPRGGPAWRTALTTNLLNPKIAVFYTGLLPQLVPRGAPVTVGLVGLVAVHVLLTLTWLNLYAALLQRARTALQRPRVRMVIDRFTGLVLIGFGLRVATQHD